MKLIRLWMLALGLLSGCSLWTRPDSLTPGVIRLDLEDGTAHLAAPPEPGSSVRNQLLVWLPGTASGPGTASRFLHEARREGYHVLSLSYSNQVSLGSLCQNDLGAYGPARDEVLWGRDSGVAGLEVTEAQAIVPRLRAALSRLAGVAPGEGWEGYLTAAAPEAPSEGSEEPRWERLVLAGFSQGGGHAARLAQQVEVAGVLLFAAPADGRIAEPRQSADWIASGWQGPTPVRRVYSLLHADDGLAAPIELNWKAWGLEPGQRGLVTGGDPAQAHGAVCEDGASPVNPDGSPAYAELWRQMLRSPDSK